MNIKELESGFKTWCGFTTIEVNTKKGKKLLTISHGGNMGNTIEDSVDPNLKIMGFPKVGTLKETFPIVKEEGSPNYSWYVMFDIGSDCKTLVKK